MLGLTLISYAVNLFLFAMGRLGGSVAVIGTPGSMATRCRRRWC